MSASHTGVTMQRDRFSAYRARFVEDGALPIAAARADPGMHFGGHASVHEANTLVGGKGLAAWATRHSSTLPADDDRSSGRVGAKRP